METFPTIFLLTFLGTLYTAQASPVDLSELTQLLEPENLPLSAETQDARRKRSVMGKGVLGTLLGLESPNQHEDKLNILDVNKTPNNDHLASLVALGLLNKPVGNSKQAVEEKPQPQSQPQGNGIMFVVKSSDPETQKQLNKLTDEQHHKLVTFLVQHQQEQEALNNPVVNVEVGKNE